MRITWGHFSFKVEQIYSEKYPQKCRSITWTWRMVAEQGRQLDTVKCSIPRVIAIPVLTAFLWNVVKKTGTYWDLWRREVQIVKHQYQDIQTEVSVIQTRNYQSLVPSTNKLCARKYRVNMWRSMPQHRHFTFFWFPAISKLLGANIFTFLKKKKCINHLYSVSRC